MIKNREMRGFTLIELLVVISIIGILATLLMANVAGVRERARDAQRKSDINQIQKALEMYKNSQPIPQYPESLSELVPDFMKTVPQDPSASSSGWPNYSYTRDPTDVLKYTLKACLENSSDPQKDTTLDSSYCSVASYTRSEP